MPLPHPKQVLVAELYSQGSVVTPPPGLVPVQVLQPKLPPGVFQKSPFPVQMKPEPFPEQGQQQALSSAGTDVASPEVATGGSAVAGSDVTGAGLAEAAGNFSSVVSSVEAGSVTGPGSAIFCS